LCLVAHQVTAQGLLKIALAPRTSTCRIQGQAVRIPISLGVNTTLSSSTSTSDVVPTNQLSVSCAERLGRPMKPGRAAHSRVANVGGYLTVWVPPLHSSQRICHYVTEKPPQALSKLSNSGKHQPCTRPTSCAPILTKVPVFNPSICRDHSHSQDPASPVLPKPTSRSTPALQKAPPSQGQRERSAALQLEVICRQSFESSPPPSMCSLVSWIHSIFISPSLGSIP